VAAAIHDAVANRFLLTGGEAQIGVSIGVAFSAATTSGADVLRNADTAMYRAKALGKGRTEQFEPLMRVDLLNRLELEEQLRLAVDARALTVAFQPIVDLSSGVIDGFEALARWTHPTLGSIPPDVFIPMAERLGVIAALDDHILVTAHAQMRRLMQRTGISLTLSVNIAPSQVGDPALLDCVRSLIASEPAMRLILELTEESLLADDPDTLEALRQLTDTGARLAVDDFGVGYSSIGYLHRLPVDRIKIDKSLVQDLAVRRSYLLVQGVVAMARAMDLQVVVEGIEDVHTAVLLRDLGCQRAQGYLFSPPVDLAAAEFLLRQGVTSAWAASPELMAPARARSA
jgi:EAL domain-containing protein (putative c-di-GMP-specific phosphodiesterase class I)